jgi:antirestriction protein ArdC
LAEQGGDVAPAASEQLKQLLTLLNIGVSEFGNQPHFQPGQDVIIMPRREFFNSKSDYDVTLLHEMVHWTGHASRLNRSTIRDYDKSDFIRAEEELIAEIGSVFLAAYFGLSGNLINHASYVASWKKHLDAKAVGRAISQASKAFEWLASHLESQIKKVAA